MGFITLRKVRGVRVGVMDVWLEVKRDGKHQGKWIRKTVYSGWM